MSLTRYQTFRLWWLKEEMFMSFIIAQEGRWWVLMPPLDEIRELWEDLLYQICLIIDKKWRNIIDIFISIQSVYKNNIFINNNYTCCYLPYVIGHKYHVVEYISNCIYIINLLDKTYTNEWKGNYIQCVHVNGIWHTFRQDHYAFSSHFALFI